jgi:hypothetical protein
MVLPLVGEEVASEVVLGATLGVQYVSGLPRRLESRSWQKAGVSSGQLAGGESPVDGRCYKELPLCDTP